MIDEHYGQIFLQAGPVTKIQWFICAFTQSPAFHAGMGIGGGLVISAQPGGVAIEPEANYPHAVWSRFPLTPAQADGAVDWVKARQGRPYNWIDDAMIGIENTTNFRFPQWITRRWDNDKSYQCAMLVDAALTHGAGLDVFTDHREPGRVSPGSLQKLFVKLGYWPAGYWAMHAQLTRKG